MARLQRTLILHSHDPLRVRLIGQLSHAAEVVGADRAAVLWLDDYDVGLAHPHTILDLVQDKPRRGFSPGILRSALGTGIPGLVDLPNCTGRPDGERCIRSSCAVALGSDGFRSWFLVVDSLSPRPPAGPGVTEDLMFIAGECASLLLHGGLDRVFTPSAPEEAAAGATGWALGQGTEAFSGWPILQDAEGRRGDEELNHRIAPRFLVARAIRGLVEDDFAVPPDSVARQARGIRRELRAIHEDDPERAIWEKLLASMVANDLVELSKGLLDWGGMVEGHGHLRGAREIQNLAYELAVATGSSTLAADAARFQARVCRKLAEWNDALSWYGIARKLAEETQAVRMLAAVLDGMANTFRDRGNLPRAREVLEEILSLGRREVDDELMALAYHNLMTVEKQAGDLEAAVVYGWKATLRWGATEAGLQVLFDLAGVLREGGDLSAAEDAYSVVAARVQTYDHRVMSLDALAYISALRGRDLEYEALRETVDAEGWRAASPVIVSQILHFRGLSELALGRYVQGREWLTQALDYAERHGFGKLIFDTEKALAAADGAAAAKERSGHPEPVLPHSSKEEVEGVRQELREMREALVGAGQRFAS